MPDGDLADVIWSSDQLSLELRGRLKAQVAVLAYTLNRDDYWSPPRGFAANPNMTSTVAAYRAQLGAMIPAHPKAATWIANGVNELKRQLDHWSDDDGGWLEAPHYAMVSFDNLLGVFLMAKNAGFADYLYDPRMKKITQLCLIAGTNHEHYDQDSGSFTLWAKGRLIANDFGYSGEMPGDDHSMVVAANIPGRAHCLEQEVTERVRCLT